MIEFNIHKKMKELESQGLNSKQKWAKMLEFFEKQEHNLEEYDVLGKLIDVENEIVTWLNQGQKALISISNLKRKLFSL